MKKLLSAIAVALAFLLAVPHASLAKSKAAETKSAKSEKLDINSASEAELKELPGIGDAYAKKIIAGRPYKAKDELHEKGIIPKATYKKIQSKVVAHQVK